MKIRATHGWVLVLGMAMAALTLVGCATSAADRQAKAAQAAEDAIRAQDAFEQATDRAPSANTLYALARVLSAQHRDAESQAILAKVIREHPDYMAAYIDLAELQMRARKVDGAIATLDAGLKVAPQHGVLLNDLGMCNLVKGRYEEALAYFTRAAGNNPDDCRYRANMATALGMQGRYDEALNLYYQIESAADAHYNVGVLAEARKDQDRASQEFDAAKALELAAQESRKDSSSHD